MGYNDLRDIAPVLQGHACLYGQSIHAMFQSFPMYTVVLENRPRSNLPVFKSFGGSKPLRIWQTKKPSGCTRKTGHEATCLSSRALGGSKPLRIWQKRRSQVGEIEG
ncbi:hypothetical protein TNCV_3694861 [Trichonephila clavipes]|nr:hypothetical protein TNCV_3694861 [Trichonephila clavipes]